MAKQLRDGVDVEPGRERVRREGMAGVVEAGTAQQKSLRGI